MASASVFIFEVRAEESEYVGRTVIASAWIGPTGVGSVAARAARLVAEHGFRIVALIEKKQVSRESLRGNSEGLDSLERALADGACLELYIGGVEDE